MTKEQNDYIDLLKVIFAFKNDYYPNERDPFFETVNIFTNSNEEFHKAVKPLLSLKHDRAVSGEWTYIRTIFTEGSVKINFDINIKTDIWDGKYEEEIKKPEIQKSNFAQSVRKLFLED